MSRSNMRHNYYTLVHHQNSDFFNIGSPTSSSSSPTFAKVLLPYFLSSFGTNPGAKWLLIKSNLTALQNSLGNGQRLSSTLFKHILSQYNPVFKKHEVNCPLLGKCLAQIPDAEFIIQNAIKSALEIPTIIQRPILLLRAGRNMTIEMTKEQAKAILANAFFCTFPEESKRQEIWRENYPNINFNKLFMDEAPRDSRPHQEARFGKDDINSSKIEKLKCILNYFRTNENPSGLLTFERRCLLDNEIPDWKSSTKRLTEVYLDRNGKIEDYPRALQVDFANKYVGGGIVGNGAVMEEIKFATCPELIISRLFTEKLGDRDALLISGVEQFSNYKGYGHSFKYAGRPTLSSSSSCLNVVAMDALKFNKNNAWEQFSMVNIQRELNKCYSGFMDRQDSSKNKLSTIATGFWGCGVFNGDPQLKFLIQWIAASEANKSLTMCAFGQNDQVLNLIAGLQDYCTKHCLSVGHLYTILEICAGNILNSRRIPLSLLECIQSNPRYVELLRDLDDNFTGGFARNPGEKNFTRKASPSGGSNDNKRKSEPQQQVHGSTSAYSSITGFDKYDYKKQKRNYHRSHSVNTVDRSRQVSRGSSIGTSKVDCCSVQ